MAELAARVSKTLVAVLGHQGQLVVAEEVDRPALLAAREAVVPPWLFRVSPVAAAGQIRPA